MMWFMIRKIIIFAGILSLIAYVVVKHNHDEGLLDVGPAPYLLAIWGVAAICIAYTVLFRRDRAMEYLLSIDRDYLEREGVCFCIRPIAESGIAWFELHYQNRYVNPCSMAIKLERIISSFSANLEIDHLHFSLEVGPAACGVLRTPLGIPEVYQGMSYRYAISADTHYPGGKGKCIRHYSGRKIGSINDASRAADPVTSFAINVTSGVLLGVMPLPEATSKIVLTLPEGVADFVPEGYCAYPQKIWQLGEPEQEIINSFQDECLS
jgi:hypothetical protein